MKKFIKSFLVSFLLINLGLTIYAFATFGGYSQKALALNPLEQLQLIGKPTNLPNFTTGQHPEAPADAGSPGVGTLTSPIFFALDMAKLALSGIAMIMIVIAAIKLISTTNEEDAGKAKKTLIYAIAGMILIQLADALVRKMFFGEQGEAFSNPLLAAQYAGATVAQVRNVIGLVEAFLGVGAVLIIIIRGFKVLTSGGSEEELTKAKQHLMYAVAGLFVIMLSEVVIRGVVFPENGQAMPNPEIAKYIIVKIVNYVVGFISIVAFVSLFYAGYLYVTSAGEEEVTAKVKKIFTASVIAIVLAFGAFAIVNTLITFTPYYGTTPAGVTPPNATTTPDASTPATK